MIVTTAKPQYLSTNAYRCNIELPSLGAGDDVFGGCRLIDNAFTFNTTSDQIGEGTYGQVYLAKDKLTNEQVALKRIRMENEKEGFPITAIREIKILSNLDHPNVVKLKEIVRSQMGKSNNYKGSIYMVFEYMDHDLTGLFDRCGKKFSPGQIKCYMLQLLAGLEYCHSMGILHRDLKASNLLIDNNGNLKLADFGLARTYQEGQEGRLTNRVITLWYRPPELLLGGERYGPEIDMWSVGCIFAELLMGQPLFPGRDETDQLDRIFSILGTPTEHSWPGVSHYENFKMVPQGKYKENKLRDMCKQRGVPPSATNLLERLLILDPAKRVAAGDASKAVYFSEEPRPTPAGEMKRYPSSHEWTMKKIRKKEQMVQERQGHDPHHPQQDDGRYAKRPRLIPHSAPGLGPPTGAGPPSRTGSQMPQPWGPQPGGRGGMQGPPGSSSQSRDMRRGPEGSHYPGSSRHPQYDAQRYPPPDVGRQGDSQRYPPPDTVASRQATGSAYPGTAGTSYPSTTGSAYPSTAGSRHGSHHAPAPWPQPPGASGSATTHPATAWRPGQPAGGYNAASSYTAPYAYPAAASGQQPPHAAQPDPKQGQSGGSGWQQPAQQQQRR